MRIGNIELDNNVFLAPMAGVTDLAFRLLAKDYGAGLTYSEMISAKALYYKDKKTQSLMKTTVNEKPFTVQIFGSEPDMIAYACKVIDHADIIDINMGCPTPKIVNNGDGGALMKNPKLIGDIVSAAVSSATVPITVKMRTGWDENNINAAECAKYAEDAGAAAITVHGRTISQQYSGKADWEKIALVKQSVSIPVIGNGDITTVEDAASMIKTTNCDAIMIGRATLGRVWFIKEVIDYLRDGRQPQPMTVEQRVDVACEHIKRIVEFKGEHIGVKEARKHALWYLKGIKDSSKVKDKISHALTLDTMLEYINSVKK